MEPQAATHAFADTTFAARALARLREAGEPIELARFWPTLCSGELSIVELFSAGTSSIVLLRRPPGGEAAHRALRGRRLEILERVLEGQSLNFVALDLGLSASTVSTEFRRAATALGIDGSLAQLPVFVAQLWYAKKTDSRLTARFCFLEPGDADSSIVAVPRFELKLLEQLPPAEFEVCRLLLDGLSHTEIAESRDTSPHTTANQISSIFRKLGVSGRLELLTTLVRESSATAPAQPITWNESTGVRTGLAVPETRPHYRGVTVMSAGGTSSCAPN